MGAHGVADCLQHVGVHVHIIMHISKVHTLYHWILCNGLMLYTGMHIHVCLNYMQFKLTQKSSAYGYALYMIDKAMWIKEWVSLLLTTYNEAFTSMQCSKVATCCIITGTNVSNNYMYNHDNNKQ